MSSLNGGWIHTFTITDTSIHKKGYTLYKITSIVFPRAIPEALTCITVWKRFDEVKCLYREICKRHKDYNIQGEVPIPHDFNYFKRFEPKVIQSRKEYILKLLYFITQHPLLYKSQPFMQFFECGLTPKGSPNHKKINTVDKINAKLNVSKHTLNISDNENKDHAQELVNIFVEELNKTNEKHEENADKSNVNFSKLLTPLTQFEGRDNDYIYEAALYFSQAVQAEVNLDYREAFDKYKHGVDLLSFGSRDDKNEERTFIAKAKIAKYWARANEIFDNFLLKENNQISIDLTDKSVESTYIYLERPWNHLSKFKVLQILETVMQVQNVTDKSIYIMKGIEKPSINCTTQAIFLPQNVPYMVQLVSFFQSDQKMFLLLRQAMGGKLFDYVKTYTPTPQLYDSFEELFSDVDPDIKNECNNSAFEDSLPTGYCIEKETTFNIETVPSRNMNTNELLNCSQNLLKSVTSTLNGFSTDSKTMQKNNTSDETKVQLPNFKKCVNKLSCMPEGSVKQWARELVVAINGLHMEGVLIRDLHSDNLMLGSKGQLLLTYIYQNDVADNYNLPISQNCQAFEGHFIAPERPLTINSDWWSFGVILFELLTGYSFKVCHPGGMDMYMKVQYPDVNISDVARNLLSGVLQKDPDLRFDIETIKSHQFFDGTNWNEVAKNGIHLF